MAMFTHRLPRHLVRQFTAWLAALSVLCAGLLPLLSHAVVPHLSGAAGMVEVCTVTGMAWVKLDGEAPAAASQPGQTGDPSPTMGMADCDWCATHLPLAAVPPVSVAPALPATVLSVLPTDVGASHHPLPAWAVAQPRAPPSTT
ncbi:MAG: hypothetical protein C0445_15940 [Polaromonas sp.]|nr:hypothetical protein [Polaromonas sp.]